MFIRWESVRATAISASEVNSDSLDIRDAVNPAIFWRAMTIGIGVLCRDGILLGADTEVTGWIMKTQESKIRNFECPYGKVAMVSAGAATFAESAVEKCERELKQASPEETLQLLETVLDREYRRNVADPAYAYTLLIALWSPVDGLTLLVTHETAMRRAKHLECIGVGGELARFLFGHMTTGQDYISALTLSAYALARVKESVGGCGGASVFMHMRADGNVGVFTSDFQGLAKRVEQYARAYEFTMRELFVMMANPFMPPDIFEKNVQVKADRLRDRQAKWFDELSQREAEIAALNRHLSPQEIRKMTIGMDTRGRPD